MTHIPDTAIRLVSGEVFDYADPMEATITLHDVAHSLARTTRYAGQCRGEYSVAAHTILVAYLVRNHFNRPELTLAALHHDDVEAFTGDWPKPLKVFCEQLGFSYRKELERKIEPAICRALGLVQDDLHAGVIKDADMLAYAIESAALKPGHRIDEQRFGHALIDVALIDEHKDALPLLSIDEAESFWLSLHHSLVAELEANAPEFPQD